MPMIEGQSFSLVAALKELLNGDDPLKPSHQLEAECNEVDDNEHSGHQGTEEGAEPQQYLCENQIQDVRWDVKLWPTQPSGQLHSIYHKPAMTMKTFERTVFGLFDPCFVVRGQDTKREKSENSLFVCSSWFV